jgi:hypothetical protein
MTSDSRLKRVALRRETGAARKGESGGAVGNRPNTVSVNRLAMRQVMYSGAISRFRRFAVELLRISPLSGFNRG